MLGPLCNHDLGVLLRMPHVSAIETTDTAKQEKAAIVAMLEAMGDHEYYYASYSSRDAPHIVGLLETLSDAVRAKTEDIARAMTKGGEYWCT